MDQAGQISTGSQAAAAVLAQPEDRIMLDSTDPGAIIACLASGTRFAGLRPSMAAVYGDGRYAASAAAQAAIVKAGVDPAQLLRITVTGGLGHHLARIVDIETGDMSPTAGALWAGDEAAPHWRPAPYVDRALKPALIKACTSRGLALGADYGLIVATLDGTFADLDGSDLRIQHGVFGIQYLGAAAAGFHVDVTLVVDRSWIPVPAPPVTPALALAQRIRAELGAEMASLVTLLGG